MLPLLATTLFVLSSGFGWIYAVDLAILTPSSNMEAAELTSIDIIANVTSLTYDVGLPASFINVGHPDITTPLLIIALPAGFTLMGMIKGLVIKNRVGDGPSIIDNLNENKNKDLKTVVSDRRPNQLVLDGFVGTIRISLLIILISFLGISSHDEFYFFIITACLAIVVLLTIPPSNQSYQKKVSFANSFRYGYSDFFFIVFSRDISGLLA